MSPYKAQLREMLRDKPGALRHLPEPIKLASGEWSHWFIDGKRAVEDPDNLELAGAAMFAAAGACGVEFDAVGGLVLGAVPFTFAVAGVARTKWFLVRKAPKGRGTNLWVEGCKISEGTRVALVEDVVTTGGSIQDAYRRVTGQGAKVVFATALVDRADQAAEFFRRVDVPYSPLLTYQDLGIPKVGDEQFAPASAG